MTNGCFSIFFSKFDTMQKIHHRQQKHPPPPQNKIGNEEEIIITEYLISLTLDSELTPSPELCQMETTVSS